MRALIFVSVVLLACTAWAAPKGSEQAFALIVAHNKSLDASLAPLRFADDDAARFHELMATFATKTVLLAVLDDETQRTFPGLSRQARPPSRGGLRGAMRELSAAIRASRRAGHRTRFYFYYAGHGDVGSDREGYVHLLDGRFSRSDLYREVIVVSPAHVNHVIIDACNSYYMVNPRGDRTGKASQLQAMRAFLARESLDRFPNTGVVLSTASMGETHEWSRYQSGIFSHELLSALWGGADVDGDGLVDYRELAAYLAAANLKVRDVRARLSIYARAPAADRDAELVNLGELRARAFLSVPRELTGHYYLEDDRGVRHAEFHKSGEQPLRLALLGRPHYTLRSDEREALIRPEGGEIDAAGLTFTELPLHSRGSVEQTFRRDLFAFPFGRSFAAGHAAAAEAQPPSVTKVVAAPPAAPRPWYSRPGTWKWASLGLATAGLATGITFQVLSGRSLSRLEEGRGEISMVEAVRLQEESRSRQTVAGIAFGIASAAAASAAVLFLLDRGEPQPRAQAGTTVGAAIIPGGGSLSLSGSF
jgi:hypothetical protein